MHLLALCNSREKLDSCEMYNDILLYHFSLPLPPYLPFYPILIFS
jgi:hypothetical protein